MPVENGTIKVRSNFSHIIPSNVWVNNFADIDSAVVAKILSKVAVLGFCWKFIRSP